MRGLRPARALAGLVLAWMCAVAHAHLLPADSGSVRFEPDGVFALVALPVAALAEFDLDHNGRLDTAELETGGDALRSRAAALLDFRAQGVAGKIILQHLMIPHVHQPGEPLQADYLIEMLRVQWPQPVNDVTLRAAMLSPTSKPLVLRAARGDEVETVVLTPLYAEHRFFAGAVPTLARFIGLGAEHILQGLDHLLFLLTVLVVGTGWRYWLAVVTSFTLAHSITLTLAAFGWVQLTASVAEPLIALSIIAVAWDNVRRGDVHLLQRSVIVFACGLVHGLGFARALTELGGADARWLQLAGFNLGVELGQLAFVAAALALLQLVRKWRPAWTRQAIVRATSGSAACIACILLVQMGLGAG